MITQHEATQHETVCDEVTFYNLHLGVCIQYTEQLTLISYMMFQH